MRSARSETPSWSAQSAGGGAFGEPLHDPGAVRELAEQVVRSDANRGERELRVALVVGRVLRHERDAGRGGIDQERRHVSIGAARGHEDALREVRGRDADLHAVEHEAVARRAERRRRTRRLFIGRFEQRCAEDQLAAHDAREPAPLLRLAAEARDRERPHHQRGERRDLRHRAAELLEQQAGGEEAEVAAAEGLGQAHAEQVGARELAPQLEIDAVGARLDLLQPLVRAAILEDLARKVPDFLLFFGERKIHGARLSSCSAAGRAPSSR